MISVTVTNDEASARTFVYVTAYTPQGKPRGPTTTIPSGEGASFRVHPGDYLVVAEHGPELSRRAA